MRGRIVGAVLVTTVATLAIAALALLGPLEHSLRQAEQTSLQKKLSRREVRRFEQLPPLDVVQTRGGQRPALAHLEQRLQNASGASVTVFGWPGSEGGQSTPVGAAPLDDGMDETRELVAAAFRTNRHQFAFFSATHRQYAEAAIPFVNDRLTWVLAARKPVEIADAVGVVRRAFLDAVLAGLALTIVLGIPLSARLVRRLERLREAALQLAHGGPRVELPVDRGRDEVSDLSRSLGTMQTRLHDQEDARRAFVATASHELRTPLASLDGMLELLDEDLREDDPDLEDARALLGRARAQSRRLGRLAADLLDLSRIDAQVQLRSEPVELGEIGRAVLAEFELGTEERRIQASLEETGEPVWALGDPGSIARILRILLDNAMRAAPDGSRIRVVLHGGSGAAISVCDEGPGVAEEEREAIFARFRRGRDTAGQAGFGLGLAIGRELAERMGGELVLEPSDGPGAAFTLRLPRAPAGDQDPLPVA